MSWNKSISGSDPAESSHGQGLGVAIGLGAITVVAAGAGLIFNSKAKPKSKSASAGQNKIVIPNDRNNMDSTNLSSPPSQNGHNNSETNLDQPNHQSIGEPEMELSPLKVKQNRNRQSQSQADLEKKYSEALEIVASLRQKLAREMAKQRKLEEDISRITEENQSKMKEHELGLTKAFEKRFSDLRKFYETKLSSKSSQNGQTSGRSQMQEIEKLKKSLKEEKDKFEKQRFELQQNQMQLNTAMSKLDSQARELEFERTKLERETAAKEKLGLVERRHQNERIKDSNQSETLPITKDEPENKTAEILLQVERRTRQLESAAILGLVAFIFAW